MELEFKIKPFNELSTLELYQLLKLRSEVFVVEQNSVYQDVDGKDQKALHVLGVVDGQILVYARLFNAGDYFTNASIGRVVIAEKVRSKKWGHELMKVAIEGLHKNFGVQPITISAQLYLQRFYEQHGFLQQTEMYLEDGLPHIEMLRN